MAGIATTLSDDEAEVHSGNCAKLNDMRRAASSTVSACTKLAGTMIAIATKSLANLARSVLNGLSPACW